MRCIYGIALHLHVRISCSRIVEGYAYKSTARTYVHNIVEHTRYTYSRRAYYCAESIMFDVILTFALGPAAVCRIKVNQNHIAFIIYPGA